MFDLSKVFACTVPGSAREKSFLPEQNTARTQQVGYNCLIQVSDIIGFVSDKHYDEGDKISSLKFNDIASHNNQNWILTHWPPGRLQFNFR